MPAETIEAPVKDDEIIELPYLDLRELREIEDLRSHGGSGGGPYIVILYNDEVHTFDDVTFILMKATGCTAERGDQIATEVDAKGRAICFDGTREDCERVAEIIATIKLQVEVDRAL